MSVWLTPDLKPFYGGTYYPGKNSVLRAVMSDTFISSSDTSGITSGIPVYIYNQRQLCSMDLVCGHGAHYMLFHQCRAAVRMSS